MSKIAWNKEKAVGQKKAFTYLQAKALKIVLTNQKNYQDLALFSLSVDSMLRSSDISNLKIGDVVDFKGLVKKEILIKQKKTKRKVVFKIADKTAQHIQRYLLDLDKFEDDYLFTACNRKGAMSRLTHSRKVKAWAASIGLDSRDYSTHSTRRTNPTRIYKETKDIELLRNLLGHKSVDSTIKYLSISHNDALKTYEEDFLNN